MSRLLLAILCAFALILPQTALAKSKIDTARDYAKIEKKYEAKELLDEAILDDPLDADVHYEAGLVYGQLGMTSDFDLAMKNACKLKSSYCSKVAEPYYSMGLNYLNSGSQRPAIRSFEKAFAYNPAKKQGIITEIYSRGEDLLSSGKISSADSYFTALTTLDSSYRQKIADAYFQIGSQSNFGSMLDFYKTALSFSADIKDKIEAQVIKRLSSGEVGKAEKKAAKPKVVKLVSKANFKLLYPPDYRELKVGERYITRHLKAGEADDLWIRAPQGVRIRMLIAKGIPEIKIRLRNGKEYLINDDLRIPEGDFDIKFVGIEDGAVGVVKFKM